MGQTNGIFDEFVSQNLLPGTQWWVEVLKVKI